MDAERRIGALTVALTVTIVEAALRREADFRLKPRRDAVMARITSAVAAVLRAIVIDYTQHHLDNFRAIPEDGLAMIDQWHADRETEDNTPRRAPMRDMDGREIAPAPNTPMLLDEAIDLSKTLERHRGRDREVLPVDVITAIDEFDWYTGQAQLLNDLTRAGISLGESADETNDPECRQTVVDGVQGLAKVIARYRPEFLAFQPRTRQAAESHSATLRALRDQARTRAPADE
jgi:hypothetical protein